MLSDFPCAIENIFCLGDYNAYAIQRGSSGQIIRKEAWLGISNIWDLIKSSNPSGLARGISQPRLLHTMMHLNCTKRQLGLPCDDAIPTGGQLIRVSEVMWDTYRYVVWSSQSFRQDEHEHVSSMPLVGPRSL
ncbi:hypothetical protein BDV93DRAFT_170624 [Ceratobasidium sp. AG-I]|nr:hypothetical protein BDV93DRAFT_170624 [Ceratobasidium sp. AG-I]